MWIGLVKTRCKKSNHSGFTELHCQIHTMDEAVGQPAWITAKCAAITFIVIWWKGVVMDVFVLHLAPSNLDNAARRIVSRPHHQTTTSLSGMLRRTRMLLWGSSSPQRASLFSLLQTHCGCFWSWKTFSLWMPHTHYKRDKCLSWTVLYCAQIVLFDGSGWQLSVKSLTRWNPVLFFNHPSHLRIMRQIYCIFLLQRPRAEPWGAVTKSRVRGGVRTLLFQPPRLSVKPEMLPLIP